MENNYVHTLGLTLDLINTVEIRIAVNVILVFRLFKRYSDF